MASRDKPGLFDRLKGLFGGPLSGFGKSGDDSELMATRAEEKARAQQRKRDEFVRRRELETLRRLRDSPKGAKPDGMTETEAPPSTTSGPPSDISVREATLRKINEIERMMSVDVKGGQPPGAVDQSKNRAFLDTQPMQMTVGQPVVIGSRAPAKAGDPAKQALGNAFKATRPLEPRPPAPPPPGPPRQQAAASGEELPPHQDFMLSTTMGGFMPSAKSMAMEVQEVSHDPVLEEAAIHFANADYRAAEQTLKAAIAPDGPNHRNQETWRALFDLYRATGNQFAFEAMGLDFVDRFETSAPNWFDLNQLASGKGKGAEEAQAPGPRSSAYVCQPKIDNWAASQTAQFIESKLMSGSAIMLDFSKVAAIDPAACEVLTRALQSLGRQPVQVTLIGARTLQRVLAAATPSMQKTVPVAIWLLRLEVLRLLGKHEDYDNVALEYTLTYEMSPPAWSSATAAVSLADSAADSNELQLMPLTGVDAPTSQGPTTREGDSGFRSKGGELIGEVTGGDHVVNDSMRKAAMNDPVVVSCALLKRIDFASAGMLLNWVLEQQGHNKTVILSEAHRLVAAFFNVIGISAHAKITLRRD